MESVLKRIALRVLIYPFVIVGGSVAMVLTINAFPWLPAAFILAFAGLGLLACVLMPFVVLSRVFWWI